MRKRPRPGVYVLRDNDDDSGRVVRVGRTKDMNRRQREHRRDPLLARFDFEEAYDTASYPVQRGLEQLLHDQHRPRFDIIEPISARSPRRHISLPRPVDSFRLKVMARKKLPYQRGSIVQVPIADARCVAVGVIGDLDGSGGILGFFYLLDTLPANWAELRLLAPQDARLVRHCGDLGLMNGTWTVLLEPAPDFDPTPWQRLEFGLQQELTGLWVIRTYAPGVFEAPESRRATEEEARALPKDGMAGAGWIEGRLSRIAAELRDKPTKPAAPPRRRAAA